jgi:hypothetical protein
LELCVLPPLLGSFMINNNNNYLHCWTVLVRVISVID